MSIFMLDIRLTTRTFEGDNDINSNLLYDLVAQMLKNLSAMRETGFNPRVRKIPWRKYDNPLQYSWLENSMDRGAWWTTVHRVAKRVRQTERLIFSLHFHFNFQMISTKNEEGEFFTDFNLCSHVHFLCNSCYFSFIKRCLSTFTLAIRLFITRFEGDNDINSNLLYDLETVIRNIITDY